MKNHVLGYPRVGAKRELKKATESYWAKNSNQETLEFVAYEIRKENWKKQQEAGIDLIPVNDFSFYDQVLDTTLLVGAVPERYQELLNNKNFSELEVYFAMARGLQTENYDITAMEMTKWFDTNYHYIVPEFVKNQTFQFLSKKIINEYKEAVALGINAKPVLISPASYLLLGKEKEAGFDKLDLLNDLLVVYKEVITELEQLGATYIQIDEPFLALNLTDKEQFTIQKTHQFLSKEFPKVKFITATYFDDVLDNLVLINQLPGAVLHVDLTRGNETQLDKILQSDFKNQSKILSLGLVDGRNIWKNDITKSITKINKAKEVLGADRVWVATSSSLLHVPVDLESEEKLDEELKSWLSFAAQKLEEVVLLQKLSTHPTHADLLSFENNKKDIQERRESGRIHKFKVKNRECFIKEKHLHRKSSFRTRKIIQTAVLQLPLYPTTTIGSFPQTPEVRSWRAKHKKGLISNEEYNALLAQETKESIEFQENVGLDVLVHGEFERNDMVEYFGEQLEGFAFTQFGWVQSYGTRCVKPPIIFGDVERLNPMTLEWIKYAQSLTNKYVKGMLTGPVTILQWSFVRDDQPRKTTCNQIALAIRDEVVDLEAAGIKIIQIDEPAIREGLPLKKEQWNDYLTWAVNAFKLSASGVKDETQIHTHMCYSEFNDIIKSIADMDADVITIECSRSQMELLDVFAEFNYPNEIGPGVYDIHSPRVPSTQEVIDLIEKAEKYIPKENIWINPDCGLKTRKWPETKKALEVMVNATQQIREKVAISC
ncbi:5-methyltetrahydropteroyltriglutamate--homocysteine S-methyltransferase [Wenyingzhuangia marina]|uniref:5-methyltetrahydropteroyltriglutamate--homocysteine methyltransferase n=1 Tax=Wenyingzhuangia marina TaxID=1195760 RepID=A0A1M5SRL1_9FLAO|nr:5-methyltetrahydropteroyltriglutamate--homocysteine S-methyltransferase [Wenyingzhuangia marina]GGF63648.1 5-methyltetrahydropteroyltriglutamate--homocysteine methyltransferase [Wenyingzhuangia marina]SHH41204.1 methionine synthase (B12-independent) [Wenyingzhuangia marina]